MIFKWNLWYFLEQSSEPRRIFILAFVSISANPIKWIVIDISIGCCSLSLGSRHECCRSYAAGTPICQEGWGNGLGEPELVNKYLGIERLGGILCAALLLFQQGHLLSQFSKLVLQHHIVLDGVVELLFGSVELLAALLSQTARPHKFMIILFQFGHLRLVHSCDLSYLDVGPGLDLVQFDLQLVSLLLQLSYDPILKLKLPFELARLLCVSFDLLLQALDLL